MRKLFTIFSLLMALSLLLAACGGGQAPEPAAPEAPAEEPAAEEPMEKVTITIESWRKKCCLGKIYS